VSRREGHQHHAGASCGPECRYRGLYEGSQRSLTDLASRQAEALGRIGRLRNAIVLGLKRVMPTDFTEAERALGRRLSEVEDDLLGAYLESFLLLATGRATTDVGALARVRTALAALGIDTHGTHTLADLAALLERRAGQGADLTDLFDHDVQVPGTSLSEVPSAPGPSFVRTGATAADTSSASPSVVSPETTSSDDVQKLDDIFSNAYEYDGGESSGGVDHDYFDDHPDYPEDGAGDEPGAAVERVETAPVTADASSTSAPGGDQGLDGLFDRPQQARDVPADDVPETGAQVTTRAVSKAAGGLRPTLLPQTPKTKQRRTARAVRTSAIPGESAMDVPLDQGDGTVELGDAMRDRLLAAVCIPRPVFSADLVDLVKSAEVVADWEASYSEDLSVRTIAPKARHRMRGSLIFPKSYLQNAPAEFKRSLWARCMSLYQGAKLYELGVILHRYGAEIVSDELGPYTVLLRLARPQGLVGLLVVLEPSLAEGEPARAALVSGLETLMRERMVQIAVLTTHADLVNAIAAVVAEEADAREWAPTMPVTLARSWEYTNGTGVALPLLGV
jgi:hypothetical protein